MKDAAYHIIILSIGAMAGVLARQGQVLLAVAWLSGAVAVIIWYRSR